MLTAALLRQPDKAEEKDPHSRANRDAGSQYNYYSDRYRAAKQTIRDYISSKYQQYGGWKKVERLIIVLTVLGVWIYTGITGCLFIVSNMQSDIARQALIDVQRAFVYIRELKFEPRVGIDPTNPSSHPPQWWFTPVIENSGATPTKNMRILLIASCAANPLGVVFGIGPKQNVIWEDAPRPGPRDPEDRFAELTNNKTDAIIFTALGPKASFPMGGIGIPPEYFKQAIRTGKEMYFYGVIHYEDVFDRTHVTKFCYGIGPKMNPADELEPVVAMCGHWNCSDDECKHDREQYIAETKDWVPQPIIVIPPAEETTQPEEQQSPNQPSRNLPGLPEVPHYRL
jgi:hypothetical protein